MKEPTAATSVLPAEDIRTLQYFLFEKGDVTRWVEWPAKGPILTAAIPELDDLLRAERVVEALKDRLRTKLACLEDGAEAAND